MEIRLQKFLADCGICSRRKAEKYILEGKVKVNNQVVVILGTKINPNKDVVLFDNKKIGIKHKKTYVMLNKPKSYVTTSKDQFNRNTVLDLVNIENTRIFPIGRLDFDTTGLLLLTNDGELAYILTHPKHKIKKTYMATVFGTPTEDELSDFRNGLKIEDYTTARSEIKIVNKYMDRSDVLISIFEGKNRQIRKMCEKINHPVIDLKRIKIGDIELGTLKSGAFRNLNDTEVKYLEKLKNYIV